MGAGLSMLSREEQKPDYTMEIQLTAEVAVEAVIKAVEDAGNAILEVYNGETSKWEVEIKGDNSPLTRADKEANTVICDALQRISPHIPIITEEEAALPYDVRQKYQYFWLVDPLDGTKEFLKRNGQFTVNVALCFKDTPVMGVVGVPCQGKTYWAVKGKGAWRRDVEGQQRIQAAQFGVHDEGLKICASASHLDPITEEFMGLFKNPEAVYVGSSLKFLMVAEGSAHIYPRFAPTMEWDTCAADIIVREAGGAVLQAGAQDNKGNALGDWKDELLKEHPVAYNKPNLLSPMFVVFGARREGDATPAAQ